MHTVSVPNEALLTPPDTGASANFKFLPSSIQVVEWLLILLQSNY